MEPRLAWFTDTHLNFLKDGEVEALAASIRDGPAAGVLLTGDITEGPGILHHFSILSRCAKPLYFVFGNHDFYRSTFERTREKGRAVMRAFYARYLTESGPVPLTPTSFLVGQDGWADGRAGDFLKSEVDLNDYYLIQDFAAKSRPEILRMMRRLSDEGAARLVEGLKEGFASRDHAYLLTHAPPFREAHLDPRGEPGDDDWSPHFVQAGLGDALLRLMRPLRDKRLTVLCGHTHTGAYLKPLPNLEVRVGDASYGQPEMAGLLEVE
jgi:predicted MPP superfamily phosphohydrolase